MPFLTVCPAAPVFSRCKSGIHPVKEEGIDYHGEQFIIKMKIWHGKEYHERGEVQLVEYLDRYQKQTGYMLSFN